MPSAEKHLVVSADREVDGHDYGESCGTDSDSSIPASPLDPRLKKIDELIVAEK